MAFSTVATKIGLLWRNDICSWALFCLAISAKTCLITFRSCRSASISSIGGFGNAEAGPSERKSGDIYGARDSPPLIGYSIYVLSGLSFGSFLR